jgi:methylated-DNA-protein-cysteine methyltransferase-like protein
LRSVKTHAPTWSESVYAVARMIPRGKVATYGQIAALLGRPRGGREVGWALSGCDDPRVPCHRVVDRNGRLAPHFREQRARLREEQVTLKASRVDLEQSAWRPSTRAQFAIGRVHQSR